MTDNRIQTIVEQSLEAATGEDPKLLENGGVSFFSWLVQTGETLPPWWSRARDVEMSKRWKMSNHLATAIYNTQAKLVGIPPKIVAIDTSNDDHQRLAEEYGYVLNVTSGFGAGWGATYAPYIEDFLTSDNGGFLEVLGDGDSSGPIIGPALGVRHLDSMRCTRTGHPLYPVLVMGDDGKQYRMHWTRVIFDSQMPSPRKEMHGVGLCAVSRSFEVAQTLMDMVRYKQERLGSRPHNQILVGKGITGTQIMQALARVEEQHSNQGYTRYARTVAIGSENPEIGLEKIDLNHMEPFHEEISVNLGMYIIAAALGMDADEIWPTVGKSGSSGDANLRRIRSRGRLPSQLTASIAAQFNYKVLPPFLRMEFDFRDDEEDQQRAVISDIRGRNRERDLVDGTINIRTARKTMRDDGDIDQKTYEEMEIDDGRLPDGTSIALLFFDNDPVYVRHLRLMPDPLRFVGNVMDEQNMVDDGKVNQIIDEIQTQKQLVFAELSNTGSDRKRSPLKKAIHALDWLEEQYLFASGRMLPEVPTASRRLRVDTRVAPEETTPEAGVTSPAQAVGGGPGVSENVTANE